MLIKFVLIARHKHSPEQQQIIAACAYSVAYTPSTMYNRPVKMCRDSGSNRHVYKIFSNFYYCMSAHRQTNSDSLKNKIESTVETHKQCTLCTPINLLENIFRFEHIVKSIWFMASKQRTEEEEDEWDKKRIER